MLCLITPALLMVVLAWGVWSLALSLFASSPTSSIVCSPNANMFGFAAAAGLYGAVPEVFYGDGDDALALGGPVLTDSSLCEDGMAEGWMGMCEDGIAEG